MVKKVSRGSAALALAAYAGAAGMLSHKNLVEEAKGARISLAHQKLMAAELRKRAYARSAGAILGLVDYFDLADSHAIPVVKKVREGKRLNEADLLRAGFALGVFSASTDAFETSGSKYSHDARVQFKQLRGALNKSGHLTALQRGLTPRRVDRFGLRHR